MHTSPEFKRDLYWDCVDSYFQREFFYQLQIGGGKLDFLLRRLNEGPFHFYGFKVGRIVRFESYVNLITLLS